MIPIYDVLIVGGGFYGCLIAVELAQTGRKVLLVEREPDLLKRASYCNQARVHQGYHYPRSFTTAVRSRESFERFVRDFPECVDRSFDKYYAVGRELSKVTSGYFETFCRRIGAPIEPAPAAIRNLFSKDLVEDVFFTKEYAFNADILRASCRARLKSAGVEVRTSVSATRVEPTSSGMRVELTEMINGQESQSTSHVATTDLFHCTYSKINPILANSGLPIIPLKHELAELALVEPPAVLKPLGITMMCGPFFSTMPFPARGLHSLSHVRYTPHTAWHEREGEPLPTPPSLNEPTTVAHMIKDAARYLPAMAGCRYVESLFEVKTVLPVSEADDSRPILFKKHWGTPGLHVVMGSKIDNIYDVLDEVRILLDVRKAAA
jgi:glycine/D-amino acid oxidase-like deaminating enzyme